VAAGVCCGARSMWLALCHSASAVQPVAHHCVKLSHRLHRLLNRHFCSFMGGYSRAAVLGAFADAAGELFDEGVQVIDEAVGQGTTSELVVSEMFVVN